MNFGRYSFRLSKAQYEIFRRIGEKKYPYAFSSSGFIEKSIQDFINRNYMYLTEEDYYIRVPAKRVQGTVNYQEILTLFGIPHTEQGVIFPDGKTVPFEEYFAKYVSIV